MIEEITFRNGYAKEIFMMQRSLTEEDYNSDQDLPESYFRPLEIVCWPGMVDSPIYGIGSNRQFLRLKKEFLNSLFMAFLQEFERRYDQKLKYRGELPIVFVKKKIQIHWLQSPRSLTKEEIRAEEEAAIKDFLTDPYGGGMIY